MAEQQHFDETLAWGSTEAEQFLRRVGLPVTSETMPLAIQLDFFMRRKDRAAIGATLTKLAAFEPKAEAQIMARLFVNEYKKLDQEFRNGELRPDEAEARTDGPLAEDYSDFFYGRLAYLFNLEFNETTRGLLSEILKAQERGDEHLAERWAKSLIAVVRDGDNLAKNDIIKNNPDAMDPSLPTEELVARIKNRVKDELKELSERGDPDNYYDDAFRTHADDPRYQPENGGLDLEMPQEPEPEVADDASDQGPAGGLRLSGLSVTIEKIIAHLDNEDKRGAAMVAAEQAKDLINTGAATQPVKEVAGKILRKAVNIRADRAEKAQALRENQEMHAEFQRQAQEDQAGVNALPRFIVDAPEFRAAQSAYARARDLQDQRRALGSAIEAAQRAAAGAGVEVNINPREILALLTGEAHVPPAQPEQTQRPETLNTIDRVHAEMENASPPNGVEQPDVDRDTGVELELRHVSMVDWPSVSDLYGVDYEDQEELQSIGTRLVKKGSDDDSALKSARQILQRSKKKKKKTKFKNAKHVVAAVLDAITRKANKQKLTKPLKPSDIDDE